jgi:hypothetical protein
LQAYTGIADALDATRHCFVDIGQEISASDEDRHYAFAVPLRTASMETRTHPKARRNSLKSDAEHRRARERIGQKVARLGNQDMENAA